MAGIEATGKTVSADSVAASATARTLEEFRACVDAAARSLGLQRPGTGAAACVLAGAEDWRPGYRRMGRRSTGGLCVLHSRDAQRPLSLSALAHAAVKESYRNTGLGRRIKLFQREDAIARGYELMEWTFDPLEIKNAYFNLERLGAIARRYNMNQYGITIVAVTGISAHRPPGGGVVVEVEARARRC